jgi:magnesium-protoporphyrin O-methyltransferase
MYTTTYSERRGQVETYFDRTAAQAWERLTSDAPVSRIRATVRAGRARMRQTILDLLPAHLGGRRVLDAGCGTGALALELAARGAQVVAVDLASKLVELAHERKPPNLSPGSVEFRVGDMLDPALGRFDYMVAMDSLIHYLPQDVAGILAQLAERTRIGIVFTFAPRTPLLALMHAAGRLFPRSDRAPAIEPVAEARLRKRLEVEPGMEAWSAERTTRIASGFYTSQALELVRV